LKTQSDVVRWLLQDLSMNIRTLTAAAVGTLALSTAGMAVAQTPYGSTSSNARQDTLGAVLGALFGTGGSALDTAWARGQRPLNDGRSQFTARIDADVRTGALDRSSASRLGAEYDALVALETRYGADRRFTPTETAELNSRYDALSASLEAGGYADDLGGYQSVADGRADFDARVNAAVSTLCGAPVFGDRDEAEALRACREEALSAVQPQVKAMLGRANVTVASAR
jgi:hypothetical protein